MESNFGFTGIEAVIFGKGPTFKKVRKEKNQIHICINESINEVDEPDVVVFNDSINFEKMDREKLKKVKLIVTPYFPHVGITRKPHPDYTWLKLKESSPELNCIWYPYNLISSKPIMGIPNFQSHLTSSNTAVEWCLYNSIKKITTYGIGKNGGYHEKFSGVVPNSQINSIKTDIEQRCDINGVELKML